LQQGFIVVGARVTRESNLREVLAERLPRTNRPAVDGAVTVVEEFVRQLQALMRSRQQPSVWLHIEVRVVDLSLVIGREVEVEVKVEVMSVLARRRLEAGGATDTAVQYVDNTLGDNPDTLSTRRESPSRKWGLLAHSDTRLAPACVRFRRPYWANWL
jgi:hypothetical protein